MLHLEVKNLSKSFAAVQALDKINFSASQGEVHAILGENGAGKSTLIKILSGALKCDEGKIYINGEEVILNTPKDAIIAGIGTVYQELSIIKDLNVAQNIFFENWPKRKTRIVTKKALRNKTIEILKKYNIEGIDPEDSVGELSLAKQQMIEIVKVLTRNPKIIILDEATSALTENKVEWLLNLSKQLASQNKIIIFISHRLQEINNSCDRITVFRNGKDVGVRNVKNTNNEELVSMMIGQRLSAYFPEKIGYKTDSSLLNIRNLNSGEALKDINLTIFKGEVLGIGGLAGQGQSSLFHTLYGLQTYSGEITLNEEPITLKNPNNSLKQGIALVPADRATEGLVQTMTIGENITLPSMDNLSKFGFIKRTKENEVIEKAIYTFKIKCASQDSKVMELSGGNQQKVLLSKYIILNPQVFLLFDCTRGVDVGTKAEIFALVRRLAKEGNAILYYSTDIEELVNICDRVAVMCDNTIAGTLSGSNITKEKILTLSVGECVS